MGVLILSAAFILGALAARTGLPPLVGYLIAGFFLHGLGLEKPAFLLKIAEIGITLLLFTIGLKLRPKNFAKPEILAGAPMHMLAVVMVFGTAMARLGAGGMEHGSPRGWRSVLLIALWNDTKRIITGGVVLGRLLRGIVQNPVVKEVKTGNKKGVCSEKI